jgi:hypothetical protein
MVLYVAEHNRLQKKSAAIFGKKKTKSQIIFLLAKPSAYINTHRIWLFQRGSLRERERERKREREREAVIAAYGYASGS